METESAQKFVFFLGGHDAEMLEIRNILKSKGLPFFDKKLSWGAKLSEYKEEIESLSEDQVPVFIELKLDCKYPHNAIIIDHHNEMAEEGRPSSIEQVAKLLQIKLDRRQKLIAANDRGHIDAMLELCASQDEIDEIRRLDQDAQGVTDEDRKLAEKAIKENLIELTPYAAVVDALSDKASPIFDHLYDKYTHIFVRTPKNGFQYTGPGETIQLLKKRYSEMSQKEGSNVEYWWGGDLPKKGYFGANVAISEEEMKKAVIVGSSKGHTIFHHSRIEKFSSMFLFPFHYRDVISPSTDWDLQILKIPVKKGELAEDWPLQRNYEEYIYFHDYVRSFIFPRSESEDATRFYSYKFKKGSLVASVQYTEGTKKRILEAVINGIYVFLYPGNIGILVVETGNEIEGDPSEKVPSEYNELFESRNIVSTGSDLLVFNQLFRRIYPAYFEKDNCMQQVQNNEFPERALIEHVDNNKVIGELKDSPTCVYLAEENIGGVQKAYPQFEHHVSALLTSFLGPDAKCFPILDDRMLVYSYVAFPKALESLPSYETARKIYFSHFLFVDNPSSSFRYNPRFVEGLFGKSLYTRWLHYGTMIGFSRYSAAFQYIGFEDYLYRPFYSMYFQMFLLSVYYRSRLIRFSDEVAQIARDWPRGGEELSKDLKSQLRNLHTEFMRFMNMYWFVEVTNQDQGIEIFALMREAFQLDLMYKQVKDEIERADELVEMLHSQKVERFNFTAGVIGILFGLAAILTGFFGMNFEYIQQWGRSNIHFFGILVVSCLLILISAGFLIRHWRADTRDKKKDL